jgi:hypothetical protein
VKPTGAQRRYAASLLLLESNVAICIILPVSLQEYKEVFEPLLLEEAGAQVLRGIEEGCVIEPYPAVVAACSKVSLSLDTCH